MKIKDSLSLKNGQENEHCKSNKKGVYTVSKGTIKIVNFRQFSQNLKSRTILCT